ncbi:hypothetical protein ACEWAY_22980, partial [Vibrio parahaemolyticus]
CEYIRIAMHRLLFFFLFIEITAVSAQQKVPAKVPVKKSIQQVYYNEPFRPQFHFTPQKFWINDPNGLIY